MNALRDKLDQIRSKPYDVRQRFVVIGSVSITLLFVVGVYLVNVVSTSADRNEQEVAVAETTKSPFSVIGDTWKDMVRYAERASDNLIPDRDIFNKKEGEGNADEEGGFVNHPGVKLEPTAE